MPKTINIYIYLKKFNEYKHPLIKGIIYLFNYRFNYIKFIDNNEINRGNLYFNKLSPLLNELKEKSKILNFEELSKILIKLEWITNIYQKNNENKYDINSIIELDNYLSNKDERSIKIEKYIKNNYENILKIDKNLIYFIETYKNIVDDNNVNNKYQKICDLINKIKINDENIKKMIIKHKESLKKYDYLEYSESKYKSLEDFIKELK